MLTRIRAVRSGSRDAGLTLADVLVGSALAGIAGTIGVSLFVVVSQQAAEVATKSQLGDSNRVALAQITSEIQFADSPTAIPVTPDGRVEVFQPGKITFYSDRDATSRAGAQSRTPPSRVSIEQVLDPSPANASRPSWDKKYNLVMNVWNPITRYGVTGKPYPNPYSYAANYPSSPTQTMVIASGIGNNPSKAGEALFTYCSSSPDRLVSSTPVAPSSSTTAGAPGAATPACDSIMPTTSDTTNRVLANRISSVIVRLKITSTAARSSADQYRTATWLTTRIAVSGPVALPSSSAP